jgi:hypothetical protein
MNRPSSTTGSRLGVAAVVGLLVLATAACSPSSATSGAVSTSKQLSQQGYQVNGLESRPHDNLLAKVTVYSGKSLAGVVSTAAAIVWRAMPVLINTLDVDARSASAEVTRHFTRAQLDQTYGPRPAGLDRDATAVATDVATDVLRVGALAIAGLAVALTGLVAIAVLFVVALLRRRRTSQLQRS